MNMIHSRGHDTPGFRALHTMRGFFAVCRTCVTRHFIAPGESVGASAWIDWLAKHPPLRCDTALVDDDDDLMNEFAAWNADAKVAYGASAAYTITLTGLATSGTWLAGREGTAVSNASNKYIDELVAGQVMVGTTPTAATAITVGPATGSGSPRRCQASQMIAPQATSSSTALARAAKIVARPRPQV